MMHFVFKMMSFVLQMTAPLGVDMQRGDVLSVEQSINLEYLSEVYFLLF